MPIETPAEFAERHGGQGITRVEQFEPHALVFPSGACMLRQGHPPDRPVLLEAPPEGSLNNVKQRRAYWQRRVQEAEGAFSQRRTRNSERGCRRSEGRAQGRDGNGPGGD